MASDLTEKAQQAFTSADYDKAIELYSQCLQSDSGAVDALLGRAHAFIKSERYGEAKRDADRAVDLVRAGPAQWAASRSRAYLRSGVASFHLGRYAEARNAFVEGKKEAEDAGFAQWIEWCDNKLRKLQLKEQQEESDAAAAAAAAAAATSAANSEAEAAAAGGGDEAETPAEEGAPVVDMPVPKIKHDWYQTEAAVIVEVRLKNAKKEQVKVEFHDTSLSVTATLPSGSDYSLELDLLRPVNAEQCSYKVLGTKIEIRLKKRDGLRWSCLEGDGSAATIAAAGGGGGAEAAPAAEAKVDPHLYPSAKGKNWNAICSDIDKELDAEKPEGEAALNSLFQKIYSDGSDEVRKAMNKSFAESGGTVLSTNWKDIKKETTEVKPPDGMEFKKWD